MCIGTVYMKTERPASPTLYDTLKRLLQKSQKLSKKYYDYQQINKLNVEKLFRKMLS